MYTCSSRRANLTWILEWKRRGRRGLSGRVGRTSTGVECENREQTPAPLRQGHTPGHGVEKGKDEACDGHGEKDSLRVLADAKVGFAVGVCADGMHCGREGAERAKESGLQWRCGHARPGTRGWKQLGGGTGSGRDRRYRRTGDCQRGHEHDGQPPVPGPREVEAAERGRWGGERKRKRGESVWQWDTAL